MGQLTIYDILGDDYTPTYDFQKYSVERIEAKLAKEYIIKNHYSHGCSNCPNPCYALYDNGNLIGVCMFATPCSENVRGSVFGKEYKDNVIELHRLHILDVTPKNAESWFVSRCLKMLVKDKPNIWAVISFSDTTEGHNGIIYQATNFIYCGTTQPTTFYLDSDGRLRHPRQCGKNITLTEAKKKGWKPVKRFAKKRYIKIVGKNKKELKNHIKLWGERNDRI